jgi:shikimate kinase
MIQLIGPGGAGKTTVGAALAERLGVRFVDLDAKFASRHGDISAYLDKYGYAAYAGHNVGVFSELWSSPGASAIAALSSGFMTYPDDVHPGYPAWREEVATSPSTFVLLPSLQVDACVKETVRRQLLRAFARSAEREERVIRARFPVYSGLPGHKVETMQPIDAVVTEILSALAARQAAGPDGIEARTPAR